MRAVCVLMVTAAMFLQGCAVSPNLLFVEKGGVKAQGQISGRVGGIELIDINPTKCSEGQIQDLWVALSPTTRMTFSELTEDAVRTVGIASTNYYTAPSVGTTYFLSGYSFRFENGHLSRFLASRYGFPPAKTPVYVNLGSQKSGYSLSLPCSLEDFEAVFGKADKIAKGFSW